MSLVVDRIKLATKTRTAFTICGEAGLDLEGPPRTQRERHDSPPRHRNLPIGVSVRTFALALHSAPPSSALASRLLIKPPSTGF